MAQAEIQALMDSEHRNTELVVQYAFLLYAECLAVAWVRLQNSSIEIAPRSDQVQDMYDERLRLRAPMDIYERFKRLHKSPDANRM